MAIERDASPEIMVMASTQTGDIPVSNSTASNSGRRPRTLSSSNSDRSDSWLNVVYKMWDIDTQDVIDRCKLALNPLLTTPFLTNGLEGDQPNSPESIMNGKSPDLWGPVWIFFTMAFAVYFSSTASDLLNQVHFSYDAGLLTGIVSTLFAFTFVVPVIVWFIIHYLDLIPTLTLLQIICLYGYSCTVWIPAVLITGFFMGASALVGKIIANIVRGTAILIAFIMSSRFVYGNLYKVMSAQASQTISINKSRVAIVMAGGIIVQAALAITVFLLTSIAHS